MRVLVAEDDARIAQPLGVALAASGFVVDAVDDGQCAWMRGDTEDFEGVILDLGLPSLDGLAVLKRWRKAGRTMPVLVLSARGHWEERVEGIEAGADDYVVKPFHIEEVVARLKSVIRRSNGLPSARVNFGDRAVDLDRRQVWRDGVPVAMTPQEYRLLALLVHNRGRVLSQSEIAEHLYSHDAERDSNSVEVLVARVRRRLGSDVVVTRRGFGYTLGGDS